MELVSNAQLVDRIVVIVRFPRGLRRELFLTSLSLLEVDDAGAQQLLLVFSQVFKYGFHLDLNVIHVSSRSSLLLCFFLGFVFRSANPFGECLRFLCFFSLSCLILLLFLRLLSTRLHFVEKLKAHLGSCVFITCTHRLLSVCIRFLLRRKQAQRISRLLFSNTFFLPFLRLFALLLHLLLLHQFLLRCFLPSVFFLYFFQQDLPSLLSFFFLLFL